MPAEGFETGRCCTGNRLSAWCECLLPDFWLTIDSCDVTDDPGMNSGCGSDDAADPGWGDVTGFVVSTPLLRQCGGIWNGSPRRSAPAMRPGHEAAGFET